MAAETGEGRRFSCMQCPLREERIFRSCDAEELAYINTFKNGELAADKGATILAEGTRSPHLYTVLRGWGFRYKLLPDGRRQILNYALPGDLLGLQGTLMEEMQHSVEALSPMLLCVFERRKLHELYRNYPGLAYDITWLAAREEQMLDENLLSLGRRTALERAAYLLAFLNQRALIAERGNNAPFIPMTQQHLADTLGLSLVHTNKTIRKLVTAELIRWGDGGCQIMDADRLAVIADWDPHSLAVRPLL